MHNIYIFMYKYFLDARTYHDPLKSKLLLHVVPSDTNKKPKINVKLMVKIVIVETIFL